MTVFGPEREKCFMFHFVCDFSNFLVKERQSDRSKEDSAPPWDGALIDRNTLTTRRANISFQNSLREFAVQVKIFSIKRQKARIPS